MNTKKSKHDQKDTKPKEKVMLCQWERKEETKLGSDGRMIDGTNAEIKPELLPPTPPAHIP